ncbi:MAG: hypothetical protein WBV43_01615, partial [Pseudolabrys sp.]
VRLIPWVPIAFGAGIACYFAADREPHVWAVLSVAIGAVAVAFVARRRPFGFPLAVGTAGVFAGLATADRHIGRLYRPWCLPDSHRSLAGRRSLGSRRAILRTPLRWSGAFVATPPA